MEAIYESSFQCIIQFVFLLRTDSFGNNKSVLIKISFIFSIWSIISKAISDDKQLLKEEYKRFTYDIVKTMTRYLWRIFEVGDRIIIIGFCWAVMGGLSCSIVLVIDII